MSKDVQLDNLIRRYYTKGKLDSNDSKSVFDLFKWKRVDVEIKDWASGEKIVDMPQVEFPEHFSTNACNIIASKYFRQNVPSLPEGKETSFKQVVTRMVKFWVSSAKDEGLISTKEQEGILFDELAYMLISQMWAPNSPQWFNTGLYDEYGIKGEGRGHFYYDEDKGEVVESDSSYKRTQGSACFILGIMDALLGDNSITDNITTETRLFKFGSGVGSNYSNIRGIGEALSGGGKSSGLMSFLSVFDKNAGAIKSGGTTRRAAKMDILDINHPEISEFINWKSREEDKVRALGKMGYSTHFNGEAYATVAGQNSNNSVRVNDDFMGKVKNNIENGYIGLTARTNGEVIKEISVKSLWEDINSSTWKCGDPGLQYDDTINAWHTCPYGEDGKYNAKYNRINASNPCSEYMFLDDTACNLASINLMSFYNKNAREFDLEGYKHCIALCQVVLESTIHKGQFPTKEIARKSYLFRTTGLGYTNLGALLLCNGLAYDSDEARNVSAALLNLLTGYSYYTSALMAQKVGAFKCFNINRDAMLKVIRNHARLVTALDGDFEDLSYEPQKINCELVDRNLDCGKFHNLNSECVEVWGRVLDIGGKYGFRNAQVSVLAPTGTIAFAMDCVTTSSEPFFANMVYKTLVGGGGMVVVNELIGDALDVLGYSNKVRDDIISYVKMNNGNVEGAPYLKEEHYSIFDTANKNGEGVRYIKPMGHVNMMAALTPNVSGAISKTVNMPAECTVEDIAEVYLKAWEMGVKAIAIYRDGSKASQPLTTSIVSQKEKCLDDYTYEELKNKVIELESTIANTSESYELIRVKPNGIRRGRVHEAEIGNIKLYITVSRYEDNRIAELYVSAGRQGSLVKGLLDGISTTISEMLQYGVDPKDIAKMHRGQKFEPSGFVGRHPYIKFADSISDLISKVLDIEMGDYTYCQVKPEDMIEDLDEFEYGVENQSFKLNDVESNLSMKSKSDSSQKIYGEVCSNCKSDNLIKNGTCKVCLVCGTTTGCS